MSLQSRLFVIIIAIVVLPLMVAGLLVRSIVGRELEQRALTQISQGARTAVIVYEDLLEDAVAQAGTVATNEEFQRLLLASDFAGLKAHMDARLGELSSAGDRLDFLVASDPAGKPIAASLSRPEFLAGFEPPSADTIAAPGSVAKGALAVPVPITSPDGRQTIAILIAGYYLDNQFAETLSSATEVDATVLIGLVAAGSTAEGASTAQKVTLPSGTSGDFESTIGEDKVFASPVALGPDVPAEDFALLVSTPQDPVLSVTSTTTTSMLIVLVLAILVASSLGYLLARGISRPIRELVGSANAIAAGNYDQHIQSPSRDEVGQLATAFNDMAMRLSEHIDELKESREKLKRALTRFGQTLRATHDLDQLLNEIVETSIDHLQARSGMVMLLDHGARELRVSVSRGTGTNDLRLKVGEGLAGSVAESGHPLRLPDGNDPAIPSPTEPKFSTAMLVPIFAQERVTGVLGLFDKTGGVDFSEVDMASLISLADQAGVAIENVILHDQAQRLSITDGLTGTWNLRYFKMQMEREIERSARFRKPFSLLMLDIDDFKVVNDTYGHQRGNAVLIDLVSRIRFTIREVDLLARWGGEEFVVILPETDASGGMLAAEKIRALVAEEPFDGNPDIKVTLSAGVACYWQHGSDEASLVDAADEALLRAKSEGKNRVVLYSPPTEGRSKPAG